MLLDITLLQLQTALRKHKFPAKEAHVHMKVSSKHMMLASPVFKAMLTSSFSEGETLRNTGRVEIPLPDDDTTVFTIILDIIHGRGKRVPRVVPLRLLALLSTAIDKYQLQEPIAIFSDMWIQEASEEITSENRIQLLLWLSIPWVFHDTERFRRATELVLRHSDSEDLLADLASENLSQELLPIPQTVLGNPIPKFIL